MTTFNYYPPHCAIHQTYESIHELGGNAARMKTNVLLLSYFLSAILLCAVSVLHVVFQIQRSNSNDTPIPSSMDESSLPSFLSGKDGSASVGGLRATTSDPRWSTFLWGIPTVESEREQRNAVRETYLSFYKNNPETPHRICSLWELETKKVNPKDCQVAYVFFMGANPKGPMELVHPNASFPMTVDRSTIPHAENDVVYLNIHENMEDGKMQTWFKYASIVAEDHNLDYISKVDSDSLVFMPTFLEFVDQELKPHPENVRVFGGIPFFNNSCDPKVEDTHSCPLELVGDRYMSGELYFMTPDLASFVGSDQLDRKQLAIRHEDVDMGNFVFSHPQGVNHVSIDWSRVLRSATQDGFWKEKEKIFKDTLWAHNIWGGADAYFKDLNNFRNMWRRFQKYTVSGDPNAELNIYDLQDLFPATDQTQGLVQPLDYIYNIHDPDSSPIVIESRKLVFFTVGGAGDVTWKKLFRRMMGYNDWKTKDPSDPETNGLKYLAHFNQSEATRIVTSHEYTRAIMVRDPKDRIMNAFMTMVVLNKGEQLRLACCSNNVYCVAHARNFIGFTDLVKECDQSAWRPQGQRMEPKYYNYLNFVGHFETAKQDARRLLEKVGAWDEYGQSGWGADSKETIFESVADVSGRSKLAVDNTARALKYYTYWLERVVEKFYKYDYDNPVLNLTRKKIYSAPGVLNKAGQRRTKFKVAAT